ncbi:MAG: filamentous hemagglutinin N-terminal domain-containing protein, partial [Candidatus Omnitrophica bacterium]|nr:filamentous hemagglutinin N-terminal domain-containing protein [Candidatus Omnitrophota bacterium]
MRTMPISKKIFISCVLLCFSATLAFCLPEVDEVKSGCVEISRPDACTMQINATDQAIINYTSFNIAQNESVIVMLPTNQDEILNRVTGPDMSSIDGSLSCNGVFVLINTHGINIGPTANIDAGSLMLSTRDIDNQDFLDGNYLFKKLSQEELDRLLVNNGTINITTKGGFAALIAGAIENNGTIAVPMGKIALACGDAVSLQIESGGLISIAIEEEVAETIFDAYGNPITDQIKNTGNIEAAGGVVIFDGESVTDIFHHAINLEGKIEAERWEGSDGKVLIVADNDIRLAAIIEATYIEVGDEETGVMPQNVLIEEAMTAEKDITILADKHIDVYADIASLTGDIVLFADKDADGIGSFTQHEGATIEAKGFGNIEIDGSLTMMLQKLAVEEGAIRIGLTRAPTEITGNPHYIYRAGNIEISEKLEAQNIGTIKTLRGDILLYNLEQSLALEAQVGKIADLTNTPIRAGTLSLIGTEFLVRTEVPTLEIYRTIADIYITSSIVDEELVTLEGDSIKLTYLKSADVTLKTGGALDTREAVLLQANYLTLVAGRFGTNETPVMIDASNVQIDRLAGDIDITDSLGIGTSILIHGPPGGWGSIIFSKNADLTLNAANIAIGASFISEGTFYVYASENLTVSNNIFSPNDIYLYAGYESALPGNFIHNSGIIEATDSGDIFIDATGDMSLGIIKTQLGIIKIGGYDMPQTITGSPYFVHTSGDMAIYHTDQNQDIYTLNTERGDILRYSADTAHLTLEADKVKVTGDTGSYWVELGEHYWERIPDSDPIYFYENMTFYNFECTAPGREIYFGADKTYTFKDYTYI